MRLRIQITKRPQMVGKIAQATGPAISKGLLAVAIDYTSAVKQQLKSGSPLAVRTGRLSDSPIWEPVRRTASGYSIRAGTNVIYARVHEVTGAGKARVTRPVWVPILKQKKSQLIELFRSTVQSLIRRAALSGGL